MAQKRDDEGMSSHGFKPGEAVIWTNYHDGTPHPATIVGPGEARRYDDDIPLSVTVQLYMIRIDGQSWDTEVSADCLSYPPRPSLQVVPDPDSEG